jgi:hypothetical protein
MIGDDTRTAEWPANRKMDYSSSSDSASYLPGLPLPQGRGRGPKQAKLRNTDEVSENAVLAEVAFVYTRATLPHRKRRVIDEVYA